MFFFFLEFNLLGSRHLGVNNKNDKTGNLSLALRIKLELVCFWLLSKPEEKGRIFGYVFFLCFLFWMGKL